MVAKDRKDLEGSLSVAVPNRPPALNLKINKLTVRLNEAIGTRVSATDPDGDMITLTKVSGPGAFPPSTGNGSVSVASIAGKPHLVCTTSAGGGVFLLPWAGGFEEPIRRDVPGGPLLVADLDGNGEPEILTATVGLAPLLAVLWNGGGR